MEFNFGEITSIKIQIKDRGGSNFERARVTWIFTKGEIRGGRITLSKKNPGKLWVQLPSYLAKNGKYVNTVRINNYDFEKYLESETLKEYNKIMDKEINGEEIDLDDIGF